VVCGQELGQGLPQFHQGVPLGVLGQVFGRRLLGDLLHGGVQLHRLLLQGHQVQVLGVAHLQFPGMEDVKIDKEILWRTLLSFLLRQNVPSF